MRGLGLRSDGSATAECNRWSVVACGRSAATWLCAAIAAFAVAAPSVAVSADTWGNARITYFEPFETTIDPRPALMQKRTTSRVIKFDGYGRRFELALEPNATLEQVREANASSVQLYRGELTGVDGSWARIATQGSSIHGLVWDGSQLYVIEPSEAVRDSIIAPLDASNTRTVLFRLADTILDEGTAMCATAGSAITTGRDSYDALKREFNALKGTPTMMEAVNAALRLEISAIGDAQFRAQFPSDEAAIDQILLRLNNVDGIFAAELGVQIQVPTAIVYDSTSDPLSTTTVATDLLRRLASLRATSPQLKARGLTHLFTGRDLDGSTVGIGYVDSVCNAEFGAALTEVRGRGAWLESLIAAHEIGHNFGAVHDGEDQCSQVPQNQFLMSPTVHAANATFSTCSRNRIAERVLTASCVTALPPADLSIRADLGSIHEGLGRTFEWELPVTNIGGRSIQDAHIEVLVPAALEVTDAWIPGGTCTSGAGVVDCGLGSIAGGVTRSLHLTLKSRLIGTNTLSARIVSLSDAQTTNNSGSGTVTIDPELDFGITLQAPTAVGVGETFEVAFSVSNAASEAGLAVSIAFELPTTVSVSAGMIENGTCDVQARTCTVETVASGTTVNGRLTLSAIAPGTGDLTARVSGAAFDPNSPNDIATQTLVVSGTATRTSSSAATVPPSSGGGGTFGLPLALALLSLLRARRISHRR